MVIGFSIALTFACALLFGIAPAWQTAKPDVLPQLKQVSTGAHGKGEHAAMRKGLIVFQIAVSVVILFAAGLLTRTLSHLQTVDLGFQPGNVLALSIDSAAGSHSTVESDRIIDELLSRIRSQSRVSAASVATIVPLEGSDIELDVSVPGPERRPAGIQAGFDMISPGYFATLRQPLLAGRDFSDKDQRKAPAVAIVNQAFASQYMRGLSPVGLHIKAGGGDVEIAGVVKTAHYEDIREAPKPQVYLPVKQTQWNGYTLLVRTTGSAADIEHVIHSVNAKLLVSGVRTLREQIDQGISSERLLSFLSGLFSALAMLLSGIGLYGIVAYGVSCRVREIGLRFAIGAQRKDVAWLFLRENLLLIAVGVAVGIPAALFSTQVLKSLLFGLQPSDAATLVLAVATLIAAGLAATVLPVRRAASIDPLTALRHE
jgi:predicted permease